MQFDLCVTFAEAIRFLPLAMAAVGSNRAGRRDPR